MDLGHWYEGDWHEHEECSEAIINSDWRDAYRDEDGESTVLVNGRPWSASPLRSAPQVGWWPPRWTWSGANQAAMILRRQIRP